MFSKVTYHYLEFSDVIKLASLNKEVKKVFLKNNEHLFMSLCFNTIIEMNIRIK